MSAFNMSELEKCFNTSSISESFGDIYKVLGQITAIASSPDEIPTTEWMQQLKMTPEDPVKFETEEQIKTFTTCLATWWNYCSTCFDQGSNLELPAKPGLNQTGEPNKALVNFASGYLNGYNWLSKTWQLLLPDEQPEAARSVLVLNIILARFINEESILKTEPEICQQLPDLEGCFKALPGLLSAVGMLGKDILTKNDEETESATEHSTVLNETRHVGRNDPCPCNSGKKFKKCCLH